jgi:purine-cytosine permease-like protein
MKINIGTILFGIIGTILVIMGMVQYDTIYNDELIFGTIWLLYAIINEDIYELKRKMEEKNAKRRSKRNPCC